MMIPPTIRMGPPPHPTQLPNKVGLVVLVRNRGWLIVEWTSSGWMDTDRAVRTQCRPVHPSEVLCWMPEDGS